MIDSGLLAECKTLAFNVAPELTERPLYVCDSDIFTGLPTSRDCLGWANGMQSATSPLIKNCIQEWSEVGPVIALDGNAIRSEYGDEDFRDGVRATVVHEAAHLLPGSSEIFSDDLESMDPSCLHSWQRSKMHEYRSRPDASHAADHDHRFVRRALHCWYRAVAGGWSVPIYRLFGGDCPIYTQPPHFAVELLREMIEMREATFAEIEAVKPPVGFAELWTQSTLLHARPPKESP